MQKTAINYLTHTWNPIAMRCTPCSPGCTHCWHLRMANRLSRNLAISGDERAAYEGEPPILRAHELNAPLHLRKPARIGVQFMGDLFLEYVPFEFVCEVLNVMCAEACQHHTFLILTKRPQGALEFFKNGGTSLAVFKNVWLGVTVCNQAEADAKIPILLQIPAAVRFLSIEPMLGPIDLQLKIGVVHHGANKEYCSSRAYLLDWVIVGPETGPGRRPTKIEDMISIVQQCRAAGIPAFVKAVEIGGKISKDPSEWPEELRVRELPK